MSAAQGGDNRWGTPEAVTPPGVVTPTERAVRDAMLRSVGQVPDAPDLMVRARVTAERIRHRRRRRVTAVGAALAVLVVAGGATAVQAGLGGPDVVATRPWPGGTSTPSDRDPSGSPVPPTSVPASAATTGSAPPSPIASDRPAGPWSTLRLDETFTAATLDTGRWTMYTGTSTGSPATTFSPSAVTLTAGGGMRITVDRISQTPPTVRAGGIKAAGAGSRYGRWEVTWRMTAGYGVTSDFLFLGEGPGGIGQVATLIPAEHRMTISDKVHGTGTDITVDSTRNHTVAIESTPQRVRWLLDGKVVVDEPGGAPSIPVVPAVQALVPADDCGLTPLPASCAGPTRFPQYLDVAAIRYWAYQP